MKSAMLTKNSLQKFDNKKYQREWYKKNKEKHTRNGKLWRKLHQKELKEYYLRNRDRQKIQDKKRYDRKRDEILKQKKEYFQKNKKSLLEKSRKYNELHKEELSESRKVYYKNNREEIGRRNRIYHKKRIKIDPLYRLITNVRRRLNIHLKTKNLIKQYKFAQYIGCSSGYLQKHIECQFKKDMSWKNYGKWHIDHITPLSSAKTEEEIYKLCHYTNLQPLWWRENIIKGNKINYGKTNKNM
jgi:hypothetical protein